MRQPRLKIVFTLAVAGALISACGAEPSQQHAHDVGGFPIDQTLSGLVDRIDVDGAYIVDSLVTEDPIDLSEDDEHPHIATPATVTVRSTVFGKRLTPRLHQDSVARRIRTEHHSSRLR